MKRIALLIAAGLSLLAGCATMPSDEIRPLSGGQLRGILARGRDPRRFWITVYQSQKGPVFSGVDRIHPEQAARLPFSSLGQPRAPLIALDTDHDWSFLGLVDTSSDVTWFDLATATRSRAVPLSPPYGRVPRHVADDVAGFASVVSRLRFDRLRIENVLVYLRAATGPFGLLARGEYNPPPVCAIGCDLLGVMQCVQIDYPNRAVMLASTFDYAPDPSNLVAQAELLNVDGVFGARGSVNGEPQVLLLDSAGDFPVAMAAPPDVILDQVTIGDLVFRKVEVVAAADYRLGMTDYPRIGRHLLSRFKVTFVPPRRVIYFERP